MAYEYVRSIAGENPKLKIIYERLERVLITKVKDLGLIVYEIPEELEYIVEDETLVLFNRIGAEGIKSERIGTGSTTFDYGEANYKVFSAYEKEISDYVNSKTEEENTGSVFIDFI